MKFMRRPDIDTVARVQIAVQAFLGLGVYGEITRIANGYRVSRLFVYKLVWQLLTLYALEVRAASSVQAIRKAVDRHILLLRLEGHCSLESISQIIGQLGLPLALWYFPGCKIIVLSTSYVNISASHHTKKRVQRCARPLRFHSTSPM